MYDNEVKNIAEWNLLHDIINPPIGGLIISGSKYKSWWDQRKNWMT